MKQIKILLMGLLTWLFGNKNNAAKAQTTTIKNFRLEEITSHIDPDEGRNVISLKIISDTKTRSSHIYVAKGLYNGKTVGVSFEVKSNMISGFVDRKLSNNDGIYANGVQMKSIGQESDDFIKAMAELYIVPLTKGFSKNLVSASVFLLTMTIADLDSKDNYEFKLFFEEGSELFFNINTDKMEIELAEKDEGYREPLIELWTR
jgi:hypothetical protein